MDKSDIDAARAQAGQVAAVLTPLLQALQAANEVLSVASNAEKYKAALVAEVDDLKSQADALKAGIVLLKEQQAGLAAEVKVAEVEAKAVAKAAAAAAREKAKAAEEAATVRVTEAQAKAAEKIVEFDTLVLTVQQTADAAVAALFTKQQTAEEAAGAAEKRLAAIQLQAQKFAAALAG